MKKNKILNLFAMCLLFFSMPAIAQNFTQVDKVVASDRQMNDNFGVSVSMSGGYAIVGAYHEDGPTTKQGAAYIYKRSFSGSWIQTQKLVASDASSGDNFGVSVSIDGNYAVVGAWADGEDENGNNYKYFAGSAYIFQINSSGVWVEIQKIVASNRAISTYFGASVAIKGDDLIVGADFDNGHAYIFKNISGVWTEEQAIAGPLPSVERFGESVAIDGGVCVVGAYQADEDQFGNNVLNDAGAAYVYERNSSGIWILTQKLVSPYRKANDVFGSDVSISGNEIVVGAPWDDYDENNGNYISNSGAAYLFEKVSGVWAFHQKIVQLNRAAVNTLGVSVSIEDNYLIAGSPGAYSNIFEKIATNWTEVEEISPNSPSTGHFFGFSVDLSGSHFIVGDNYDEDDALGANPLTKAGSAYIYEPAAPCPEMEISFTTHTTLCNGEITVSATAHVTGGTPPYIYNWSNNSNAATATGLDLGNYSVDVVDANGCPVSGDVEIAEEQFADINLTLVNSDCGRNRLDPFDAVLTFYTANLATEYRIRVSGPGVSYVLTVSNVNQFNLSDIPGLQFGSVYEVMISARIYGAWTDYGTPCEIEMAKKSTVDLKLLCEYCGQGGFDIYDAILYFNTRPDADEYVIRVTGPGVSGYTHGVSGGDDRFSLGDIPGVQYDATYTIEIGVYVDGVWMGFGTPCEIYTAALPPIYYSRYSNPESNQNDAEDSKLTNELGSHSNLKVYPNPTNNESTFMQYESNMKVGKSTAIFTIYNINGSELFNKSVEINDGKVTIELGQELNLVKGIYLVNVQEGAEVFKQKLIVQ